MRGNRCRDDYAGEGPGARMAGDVADGITQPPRAFAHNKNLRFKCGNSEEKSLEISEKKTSQRSKKERRGGASCSAATSSKLPEPLRTAVSARAASPASFFDQLPTANSEFKFPYNSATGKIFCTSKQNAAQ